MKYAKLAKMLFWKYGPVADTKSIDGKMQIIKWSHPIKKQPDEYQIQKDLKQYDDYLISIQYREKRKAEYPDIGDQLDTIMSSLKTLKTSGIDIGEPASQLIDTIDAIKDKHPKPETSKV